MADVPGNHGGDVPLPIEFDQFALICFAAAEGYEILQHLLRGGEVLILNPKTNETRRLSYRDNRLIVL